MSECLENMVGLVNCTDGSEPFKLNQIGYSVDQLQQLMDDSYATVSEFFEACRSIAVEQVITDMLTHMPSSAKGTTGLETGNIGFESETREVITQTGWKGIKIDFYNNSDYLKFVISRVRLYADFTGDKDIKVYNLNTGQEVASVTVSAVAGQIVEVNTDIEVPSGRANLRLFVGYDTAGDSAYKVQTTQNGCRSCRGSRTSAYVLNSAATISAPFTAASVSSANDTGGLMIDYNVECDNRSYLCQVRGHLGMPILYKTAMQVLEYGARSGGQFSEQKMMNAENNEARYIQAQEKYESELSKALKHMRMPVGRCFYCDTVTEVVNRLPG